MAEHSPSSLIPLHDGMVISFINYEIRVNLEKKDADDVAKEELAIKQKSEALAATANLAQTLPAKVAAPVVEETPKAEPAAVVKQESETPV